MFDACLTTIYSKDIERAVSFYRDVLGFALTYRFPKSGEPEHVELRLGKATVAFSSQAGLASHKLPPPTEGTPFELAIRTHDMDAAWKRLKQAGATLVIEPFDAPAGNRVAYISDPDGTRIQIYAPKL